MSKSKISIGIDIRTLVCIYEKIKDNNDLSLELGFGTLALTAHLKSIINDLLELDLNYTSLKSSYNIRNEYLAEYQELFKYDLDWYSDEQKKAIKDFIAQFKDEDEQQDEKNENRIG